MLTAYNSSTDFAAKLQPVIIRNSASYLGFFEFAYKPHLSA